MFKNTVLRYPICFMKVGFLVVVVTLIVLFYPINSNVYFGEFDRFFNTIVVFASVGAVLNSFILFYKLKGV